MSEHRCPFCGFRGMTGWNYDVDKGNNQTTVWWECSECNARGPDVIHYCAVLQEDEVPDDIITQALVSFAYPNCSTKIDGDIIRDQRHKIADLDGTVEHLKSRISNLEDALRELLYQPAAELFLVPSYQRGCSVWIDRATIEDAVKALEKEG